jgi:hypothetical protein
MFNFAFCHLKTDAILLKLYITKAFDTVDWAFPLDVMSNLGLAGIVNPWSVVCCWEQLLRGWWLTALSVTLSI